MEESHTSAAVATGDTDQNAFFFVCCCAKVLRSEFMQKEYFQVVDPDSDSLFLDYRNAVFLIYRSYSTLK